ncbi:lysozyme [Pararobbsia silviterrae]|uniref:Lysozyme n=1 Tax=Pararobbsia silviterrae TaxID=1792498 RepID=A0A494Y8X4_9BURK|nr:lysozyme [Pararobbsia silviterrae]RKP56350.1 lysozyme [Pararobbsia silviterrae]
MKYSKQALDLAKEFEAASAPVLTAYKPFPTDPWTIGWGHTKAVHEHMTCTPEQAIEFLEEDLADAQNYVNLFVKIGISQDEFDALVDFVLNVGPTAFYHSTMLRLLNENDIDGAIDEFDKWDKSAGHVVAGLLRRREAERALFAQGAAPAGEHAPEPEAQS